MLKNITPRVLMCLMFNEKEARVLTSSVSFAVSQSFS